MSKASQLAEREYIAVLQLVVPLVAAKQDMKLTPGDFDSLAYAKEVIEGLAAQRLEADTPAVVEQPASDPSPVEPPADVKEVGPNDPAD